MHLNCTVLLWHIDCVELEQTGEEAVGEGGREGETKDSKAAS